MELKTTANCSQAVLFYVVCIGQLTNVLRYKMYPLEAYLLKVFIADRVNRIS